MTRLLSSAEWAASVGLSPVQARKLLRDGRVPAAVRVGVRGWAIPEGTPKPESLPTGAAAHRGRRG